MLSSPIRCLADPNLNDAALSGIMSLVDELERTPRLELISSRNILQGKEVLGM